MRIKRLRGKALIEEDGYSGEYIQDNNAPALSNKVRPVPSAFSNKLHM